MTKKIKIQNFKSIKNARVNLQKVNLFIGANNSGKSNFLNALKLFSEVYGGKITSEGENKNIINDYLPKINNTLNNGQIVFSVESDSADEKGYIILEENNKYTAVIYNNSVGNKDITPKLFDSTESISAHADVFDFFITNKFTLNKLNLKNQNYVKTDLSKKLTEGTAFWNIGDKYYKVDGIPENLSLFEKHGINFFNFLNSVEIYKPDINKIKLPGIINDNVEVLSGDCSNIVAFLDTLRDKHEILWQNINEAISQYSNNFMGVAFDKIGTFGGYLHKNIGLKDNNNNVFWANEISDGILYYLAIVSILNQPKPPKLLLLEEPESQVHPRRIHDILDMIFNYADKFNVEVIITSHSPIVVDYFAEIPESIHVFEMKNGETLIKNLQDIIDSINKDEISKGLEPTDYLESLSQNWYLGILGGIPE